MLIELNYVLFSSLVLVYSLWRYFKRKERGMLYLTLGFTFLALSTTLQMLNSLIWYGTPAILIRVLELSSLALFACFTITTIITLRKISAKNSIV
jgi:hypothetical protein